MDQTHASFSGLSSGTFYSISIVALSETLPSRPRTATKTIGNNNNLHLIKLLLIHLYYYTNNIFAISASLSVTHSPSTVVAGKPVNITCSITLPSGLIGSPEFTWKAELNGAEPTQNYRESGTAISLLKFEMIPIPNSGTYSCTACLNGCINASTTVSIESKYNNCLVNNKLNYLFLCSPSTNPIHHNKL